MRKFLSLLLTMAMVLSLAVTVNAAAPKEDITILHTNDVHCDYEKYAKVATLHKSADLLVDAGDHVQALQGRVHRRHHELPQVRCCRSRQS